MALPKYAFTLSDVIKDKKVSQDEVTEVRLWMLTVSLPVVSDEMIATFVIACRRDVDNTKKALMNYFLCKKKSPEVFNDCDVDSEELKIATNTIYHASMPVRTDDDSVVHMFRLNDTSYKHFHFDPIAKLCFMLVDISLNTKSPPTGLKVVVDARGAGLMHLTRFKLGSMKRLIEYLQDAMPLNMKEIHVLNTIYLVDKILFMIKPFMKPELYKMLHLHPNNTNLEEFSKNHIPKKCLPCDYGGDLPSFQELNEKTIERYRELKEYYQDEESIRKSWETSLN
ncbi:retinaldehyde-binding protein 1-like [Coccinella septempunctata]|uniref:retinaldehyde-binding protein 1-like n=1 Tax=Coccinella septempunctata TaxID=41139 RepID=UPI001D092F6B|nr:retinaldehyde-binding protein 1-like [Coccinella septempunctata]